MPSQLGYGETPASTDTTHRRLAVILWRRKWIVIATFVVLTAMVALVSRSLPKEYESTATLWVTQAGGGTNFDAVQAGQVLAGTYGEVADNQALADQVADELPFEADGEELLESMSFAPVNETQLLQVTAADEDPVRARVVANSYARTFIDYSRTQLGDAVNADITFAALASTPTAPARPQPMLYTVAGALIALLLGMALAVLAEMLDRRVRSGEELEAIVGVPVLARIPRAGRDVETQAAFDEAFRLLRTNLQFLERNGVELRSLAVVSPSPGDGKSTVAFRLARSFAESDVRVILIEADMRRPSLAQRIGRGPSGGAHNPGLSAYLSRRADLSAVLVNTDLTALQFIPSGILPPSPSSLFSAERTRILLAEALEHADMVIVDTAPLSIGAEASTLAATADGTLMVVDLEQSNKGQVRREREQLGVVHANLLGIALNGVKKLPSVEPYGYSNGHVLNGSEAVQGSRSRRRSRAEA
jgi:capsular exopolysaccharide synthesis family protein